MNWEDPVDAIDVRTGTILKTGEEVVKFYAGKAGDPSYDLP